MSVYPVRLILLLIGALIAPTTLAVVERGSIAGGVRDASTSRPVVGGNVVVVGTSVSTVTDGNGHYVIANVPVGTYTVVARFIGYASGEKKGIRVTANATAVADLKIASSPIALQEVVVTGLYGSRAANGVVRVRGATALGYLGSEADALPAQRFDSTEAWRYQRQPGNREQYDEIVENSFIAVAADPLSTFSIDVDREGGQGIGGDGDEGILDDLVVLLAVAGLSLVAPGLGAVESLGWKRVGFGPQVSESSGATNADDAIRRTRPIESSHDDFLQGDRARRDLQISDRGRVCRDANPLLLA